MSAASWVAATHTSRAAENRPADEKAVRAAISQFNEAARKGDRAVLESLLDEDLAYSHSSAKLENKAECIQALVESKPNFELAPGSSVKIFGNAAIARGRMTAHVTQSGKPAQIPLDWMQVWVKNSGKWRMAARHTTRVP